MKHRRIARRRARALITLAAAGRRGRRAVRAPDSGIATSSSMTYVFQPADASRRRRSIVAVVERIAPEDPGDTAGGTADSDSVHDQLITQFAGGTAPDIIHDEAAGHRRLRPAGLPCRPVAS